MDIRVHNKFLSMYKYCQLGPTRNVCIASKNPEINCGSKLESQVEVSYA